MADLIVKDIQQAQQTRMVTPDYQAPNNLGNMMEGLGRVGFKIADSFADMNAKQAKEAASAQSKDNSEMTADFRRLHDARRAGSMSDEEYNIKYQDTVERWSATKSYSDINNASAITGNTPFTDYQKDLDTKIKDRQQSIDSMLDSIATSLMGPTGTDEQRKLIATKALMNSIGEVDTTGALKQFTDPKERDQFLQSRLGTLFAATTDSLESFIRANGGEINQVVLDKFRQQRLQAYKTAGYPIDFSNKLIEQVVAPYQSIADLRTTNIEKATKMQEALTKNHQTGVADKFARLSIPVQFTTTENGKKVTKTMLTTGAELQELKGIAPQTVDTIVANNYTGILNAYASDGTTSLSEDDYKYIIGPSGIGKDIVYNTKSSKSTSVSLAEKANNEVNNTVKTMTPEQMKESNYGTASMQAFNNMFGMADVEDLKANPEVWERREQLVTKAAQSAAIEINKISDGEGSLLADLNGNLRYFKASGGTGTVSDQSDAGWMIPLGEQDAIMVRDTAVASAKEMINNMAKFVGMKEAIRIFNNEAVKNNEVLRRYANGIRQGSEYASETVHFEDLPITNKEAEAAAEALLNMPEPGSYEDKRRALTQSGKEAGLAATGAYTFDWLFTKAFEGHYKRKKEASDRILKELTGEEIVDKNEKVSKVSRDPTGKVATLEQSLEDIKPEETKTEVKDMFSGNAVQVTTFQRTKPETPVMLKVNKDSEIYSPFNGSVTFVSDFKSKPTLIITNDKTEESITLLGDVKGITKSSKKIKEGDKIGTIIGEGDVEIQVRTPKDGKGFGYTRKNPRDYIKLAPPVPSISPVAEEEPEYPEGLPPPNYDEMEEQPSRTRRTFLR